MRKWCANNDARIKNSVNDLTVHHNPNGDCNIIERYGRYFSIFFLSFILLTSTTISMVYNFVPLNQVDKLYYSIESIISETNNIFSIKQVYGTGNIHTDIDDDLHQKTENCDDNLCNNGYSFNINTQNIGTGDITQDIRSDTIQKNKKCNDNHDNIDEDCENELAKTITADSSGSGNLK